MAWLITASLIAGFEYYLEPSEWRTDEQKRDDFLRMLSRERRDADSMAAQNGRDLEANVMAYCEVGGYPDAPLHIQEIGDQCLGGVWQQSTQRKFDDFLFYGKMDVVGATAKPGLMIDIKWTGHYDLGKFLDSAQHLLYLFCEDRADNPGDAPIRDFRYLICEEKYGKASVFQEDYSFTADTEARLLGKTHELMSWLDFDKEAGALFRKNWKALS